MIPKLFLFRISLKVRMKNARRQQEFCALITRIKKKVMYSFMKNKTKKHHESSHFYKLSRNHPVLCRFCTSLHPGHRYNFTIENNS